MSDFDIMDSLQKDGKLTEKQMKIIQSAIEMFAEKGYAATSTSEIAKRAGVAEGTIFRHYKTKKDLLMAIVTPMLSKFIVPIFANQMVTDVFSKEYMSFDEFLRTIFINRYDFVEKNVPLLRIVIQELALHNDLQEMFEDVFVNKVFPRFREILAYFKEKGEISTEFPDETIIRMIMTTMIGHLVTRFIVMPNFPWDDKAEMERTIEFLKKGIQP